MKRAKSGPIFAISLQPAAGLQNGSRHWIEHIEYVYLHSRTTFSWLFRGPTAAQKGSAKIGKIGDVFAYYATTRDRAGKQIEEHDSLGKISLNAARNGVHGAA
jgi:hypothetical protein